MKFSEQWLREWVNPPISTDELVEQLTLAGLEVDSVQPVAAEFNNVVIGHVLSVQQHPDADRLRVCQVDVGEGEVLQIVCGAENVRENLKVAVAKINAVLPGDFKIKRSKLRGVESHGMICSESELGVAETSSGIMELSPGAPTGEDLRDYLGLNDVVIDIDLTPNRGDCLGILGIAREVAAINKLTITPPKITSLPATSSRELPVKITAPEGCPHYVGRCITGINNQAQTPFWMVEKLRRSDIRSISPIVDITNYVLLELGQPLHGFDLNHVSKGIEVRFAKENEPIQLLDDQDVQLTKTDLVIASDDKPVALAGIKGGSDSGITTDTSDIFLESALFAPLVIARTSRRLGIYTDSSHRFERSVDYQLQKQAIDRASQLIVEIAGGKLGPVIEVGMSFKEKPAINLRKQRIAKILGITLQETEVNDLLTRLGMKLKASAEGWEVTPPSYRSDVNTEIDVIEELVRLYGYDKIPAQPLTAELNFLPVSEKKLSVNRLREVLVERGYQEVITYSFVDPEYEKRLNLQSQPLQLLNPISSDLAIMRTNHWAGLIKAYQYNYHRQQPRVRLFEIGLCFLNQPEGLNQQLRLGGISSGTLVKEQWGEAKRAVDFYDVKGDIENLLALTGKKKTYQFLPYEHPSLHPGKASAIYHDKQLIGSFGAIHPSIAQEFDINQQLYLFDLSLESIMTLSLPMYEPISKFPAIRRDVALIVASNVPGDQIKTKILDSGGKLLKNVQIFDVYQGKGIEPGHKSIALSLHFQHDSRTLVDNEVNELMQTIVDNLYKEFNATLRD